MGPHFCWAEKLRSAAETSLSESHLACWMSLLEAANEIYVHGLFPFSTGLQSSPFAPTQGEFPWAVMFQRERQGTMSVMVPVRSGRLEPSDSGGQGWATGPRSV